MEARGALLIAGFLIFAAEAFASSGIFRCTSPGGGVTYQEIPCPNDSAQRVTDIPTQYPAVDREARERLFQREAALDARQLKREELDTALRIAREERLAREAEARQPPVVETVPIYVLARPLRLRPLPPRHQLHVPFHSRPRGTDRPL